MVRAGSCPCGPFIPAFLAPVATTGVLLSFHPLRQLASPTLQCYLGVCGGWPQSPCLTGHNRTMCIKAQEDDLLDIPLTIAARGYTRTLDHAMRDYTVVLTSNFALEIP